MDILKTFLSLIGSGNSSESIEVVSYIIELLSQNSFDVKRTLTNLDFKKLLPLIKMLLTSSNNNTPNFISSTENNSFNKLEPIKKVADEEIVATLNEYFSVNS